MSGLDISSSTPQLTPEGLPSESSVVAPKQKNLAAIREQDTLDSTPGSMQVKKNSSSALAGAPEPLKRDNVSTKDAGHGKITGTSGFGNGWFSGNYIVAIAVAMNELQAVNRDLLMAEAKQEILSMKMTYEYGEDAAAQIKTAAQKEAAMHIVSAVMGGVSVAAGAAKIGGITGAIKFPGTKKQNARITELDKSLVDLKAAQGRATTPINAMGDSMRTKALQDNPNLRSPEVLQKNMDINQELIGKNAQDLKLAKEAKPQDATLIKEKEQVAGELKAKQDALQKEMDISQPLTKDANGNYPDSLHAYAQKDPAFKDTADKLFKEKGSWDKQIAATQNSREGVYHEMREVIITGATMVEGVGKIGEGIAKSQLTVEKGQADAMRTLIESAAQIRRQQMDKASRGVDEANSNAAKFAELMTNIYRSYIQSSSFTVR